MSDRQPITDAEAFRVNIEIPVRWRDCDSLGHVNNAVYFTYFEIARGAYYEALERQVSDERPIFERFPFILGEISGRFVSSAVLQETVVVHVRMAAVGRRTFYYDYLVTGKEDGRTIATGRSTQVFFDYETQRSRGVPDGFVEAATRVEGREIAKPATS